MILAPRLHDWSAGARHEPGQEVAEAQLPGGREHRPCASIPLEETGMAPPTSSSGELRFIEGSVHWEPLPGGASGAPSGTP